MRFPAVTMRANANRMLRNLTGYEVRRAGAVRKPATANAAKPPAPAKPPVSPAPAKPEPAKPEPAKPQPAKPEPTKPQPPEIKFPLDYDDEAKQIITTVRPRTMTSPEKLNALIYAVRYVVQHGIPGGIVECGVWRGGSMMAVAKTLLSTGDSERHLHLYDTFDGMSEPTEHDKRYDGRAAADMMAVTNKDNPIWAYASLDDVQEGMRETGFPEDRIHYYKGRVEETIPQQAPPQISILRLDTDWYESTKHELEHLYPLLVPGGVLILDDYGWWQGCRKAVEEFLAETKLPLLMLRTDEGRIAVKPPESFGWAR